MNPRLYLEHHSTQQRDRLWEAIRSLKANDPLTPVTVVGPSNYANLTMRYELARTGFANVKFLVLGRLAELLGAPSLASEGRRPLTPVIESTAIRAVAARASGPLAEVCHHPATHQSLKSTFRLLREASEVALERLARQGALLRQVVELYSSFRERTARFYDAEDLALAAARAVTNGSLTGLSDLGFILLFHIRDVTPGQRAMIEALADAGVCAVFLGLTGDDATDAPVEALAERLVSSLGELHRTSPAPAAADTMLLVAPDPHQEIRWAIRRIVRRAREGEPFHRMAVLYRQQAPYAALVREEFELARIPVSGPDPEPLSNSAVGRILIGLIQLSDGEFSRDAVTSWLTGCPVRPPSRGVESFSPSRWDAISREAGIVGGLEQWTQRLDRYAGVKERSAADVLVQGELPEARAAMMTASALSARSMSRFIERLAGDLVRPADSSSWSVWSRWAHDLLVRYLAPELSDSEQDALSRVEAVLSEIEGAQAVQPSPTFADFEQTLTGSLQGSVGHVGATGQGVFVGPFSVAAAMRFDTVHMVGMIEGAVPPAIRDDALIPDRSRQAAGGNTAGLPPQAERTVKERYDYLTALGSAPNRVLSYPLADPVGNRANHPSRWFLEQASALEGSALYTSDLFSLGRRPWLTLVHSMEQGLTEASDLTAADIHDYNLERLWRWTRSGRGLASHPLAGPVGLARSLALRRGRYGSGFGEWDGDLSAVAAGSDFAAQLGRTTHSPTSLERWAKCPFSYFLWTVLGISSLDKPEDVHSITPLEKGSLVHGILERFINHVREQGVVPGPGEPWSTDHREGLLRIAEDAFEDAESRGVTGKLLMWSLQREEILNDLESFLERDSQIRAQFGVSPAAVESRFGMAGDSWPDAVLSLEDGTVIRFRGVIDRVDTSSDGSGALVLDYKTGSVAAYSNLKDDPIDRGQRLQLGVYSLAARSALGDDAEVGAAYWFVTNRGGMSLRPSVPVKFGSEEYRVPFNAAVSTIVSGIRNGVFPANPGKPVWGGFENCRYCDFDQLCSSRRDVLWSSVRRDTRLADYVELSGEAG